MSIEADNKYVFISLGAHVVLLLVAVISVRFSTPLPVFENTNQHDVISAVVLGDSVKSKILPQQEMPPPPPPPPVKVAAQPKPVKSTPAIPLPKPDVIALNKADKKKPTKTKEVVDKKKIQDMFANDLLKDLKKHSDKHKKELAHKELTSEFEKMLNAEAEKSKQFKKTLKAQAEKSLRQQLLNDEIMIKGAQARLSQGEVNKYKALIIQSISEHWIIPTQANKKLYSELMIRLAPGGMVLDVQITKTSGDPSLDSSARAAVLKASPLPVPKDLAEFESFRQFVLKVKPENIL